MDRTAVQTTFVSAGLSRLIKDIDFLVQPSIRLFASPVEESSLSIGISKVGGLPDLPAETVWPQHHGLPQSFIAQIKLDDLHIYDVEQMLPRHGMLWFFYDAQQQTFGESPTDSGGWYVLFKEHPQTLQRTKAPANLATTSQFHACNIRFACEMTLPQQPELQLPHCDWTEEEVQQYETMLTTFPDAADHATIHHRMLGHPDTLQDDMRLQCQLVTHGVGNPDDPRREQLSKSALDWQLLLQIDSDEHAGMQWANAGMLYYWIKLADLQSNRFNNTWLVLQSE